MRFHRRQRHPRVNQIIDQEHTTRQFTLCHGDIFGNIQSPLQSTNRLTVGTGEQHAQRLVEDTRQNVSHTQAATRQAHDRVEVPARCVDLQCESLGQAVRDKGSLEQALLADIQPILADTALNELISQVAAAPCQVPVVEEDGTYLGLISKANLLNTLDRSTPV